MMSRGMSVIQNQSTKLTPEQQRRYGERGYHYLRLPSARQRHGTWERSSSLI